MLDKIDTEKKFYILVEDFNFNFLNQILKMKIVYFNTLTSNKTLIDNIFIDSPEHNSNIT